MVGYSQLITKKKRRPKLIITKNFLIELETVLGYSYRIFGERAANYFKEELMSRIMVLPSFPHANPINRFRKSTKKKAYRYIIFKNYFIIYSVTISTIRVISIINQAINPKTIGKVK